MKVKSIKLQNFKRFTHLVIENIPETAKLVVLLGPNGCGKSSIFDALHSHSLGTTQFQDSLDMHYHFKGVPTNQSNATLHFVGIGFHEHKISASNVYVRTAHRNDPVLDLGVIHRPGSLLEERRFSKMNQINPEISKNYQRLVFSALRKFDEDSDETKRLKTVKSELLGNLHDSMKYLFGDLTMDSLENFTFSKGIYKGFHFENLSGGEMAAFDLILDIFVKREEYNDTVFCIDEPEAHISPRIQAKLLEVLLGLINERSQLWIATHAIGMMRKAMELNKKNPGEVVFLDLGDRDFDILQTIRPTKPNREFWERTHEIALDDISALVAPSRIILCEGNAGEHGFDAKCYNQIFSDEFPDTKFISAGGSSQLKDYPAIISSLAKGIQVTCLRDGDTLSESEIRKYREEGHRILAERSIEHYLFSNEILRAVCNSLHGSLSTIPDAAEQLIAIKTANPARIKEAAKKIHQKVTAWGVEKTGSKWQAFAIDRLIPLITPETETYAKLKKDIFGNGQ